MSVKQHFDDYGYVVVPNLLDPEIDLKPIIDEYSQLIDQLAENWLLNNKISNYNFQQPILSRLLQLLQETQGNCHQYLDISLPLENIREDSPFHIGEAVFDLLKNKRLLDAVQILIGP